MMRQQEVRAGNARKDEEVYPIDTIVRIKQTGLFVRIAKRSFLRPEEQRYFLSYEAEIEGKEGLYAVYHQDVELEVLPEGYRMVTDEYGRLLPQKIDD